MDILKGRGRSILTGILVGCIFICLAGCNQQGQKAGLLQAISTTATPSATGAAESAATLQMEDWQDIAQVYGLELSLALLEIRPESYYKTGERYEDLPDEAFEQKIADLSKRFLEIVREDYSFFKGTCLEHICEINDKAGIAFENCEKERAELARMSRDQTTREHAHRKVELVSKDDPMSEVRQELDMFMKRIMDE